MHDRPAWIMNDCSDTPKFPPALGLSFSVGRAQLYRGAPIEGDPNSAWAVRDPLHNLNGEWPMSQNDHPSARLAAILSKYESALVSDWVKGQAATSDHRGAPVKEAELRKECTEFLGLLKVAVAGGDGGELEGPRWNGVREMLAHISRTRAAGGASPSETASFIFSLKKPLFESIRRDVGSNGLALAEETWSANELLDKLGLYTTELHRKARDEVILRQQEELLELSTPVIKLWDGILALPMIGTLDSSRTQIVMETLLRKLVDTGSALAIIDITGVPTVDTQTAQHLLKTITAARLMGAECIISGIRPQIAQTIVHLGVDLGDVTTKATLADALALAFDKTGRAVTRVKARK
jgi:rsbT co-antagonist protein RsbR